MKNRSKTLSKFITFKSEVENNNNNYKIKEVFSDNAKEYKLLNTYCKKQGIIYSYSPEYIPQANSFAERINRTLLNKVRAILYTSNLLKNL